MATIPAEWICDACGKPGIWMHAGGIITCDEHKERV